MVYPLHKTRTTGTSRSYLHLIHDLRVRSTLLSSRHVPHMNSAEGVEYTKKQGHSLVMSISFVPRLGNTDMHKHRLPPSLQHLLTHLSWCSCTGYQHCHTCRDSLTCSPPGYSTEGLWHVVDREETTIVIIVIFESCIVARLCACVQLS